MRQRIVIFWLVLTLLFSLTACSSGSANATVDVSELININYEGINGYAEPTYQLDEAYILKILDPKDKYSLINLDSIANMKDKDRELAQTRLRYLDALQIAFDEHYDHLKNGDTVKLRLSPNANLAEDAKLELDRTTYDVTVSGLLEGTKVDLMKGLEVGVSGYDGEGHAKLKTHGPQLPVNYRYKIDKQENLSNGDTVQVIAEYDPEQFGRNGYVVTNDKANFKVQGLTVLQVLTADDLFDDIELEFTGVSPQLELNVINKMPDAYRDLFDVTFEYNDGPGLVYKFFAIGQEIPFKITTDNNKLERLKEAGYTVKKQTFERKFEVPDNLPRYLTDPDLLTKKQRKAIGKNVDKFLRLKIENYHRQIVQSNYDLWYDYSTNYKGVSNVYFQWYKSDIAPNGYDGPLLLNRVLFFGHAEFDDSYRGKGDFYFPVAINNIVLNPDGTLDYDPEAIAYNMYDVEMFDTVFHNYLESNSENYDYVELDWKSFK